MTKKTTRAVDETLTIARKAKITAQKTTRQNSKEENQLKAKAIAEAKADVPKLFNNLWLREINDAARAQQKECRIAIERYEGDISFDYYKQALAKYGVEYLKEQGYDATEVDKYYGDEDSPKKFRYILVKWPKK